MNDKSNTYMHYPTGSFFSIDLSLCHPSLFLDFYWSVCKDQHHSDHFPIVIKSNTSTVEDHNPKWKLNKANWEVFQSLCTDTITLESFKDSSDPLSDFTSSLIDISSKCIPKTSTNPTKSYPWYNDECKEAIKTRKKALNKFKKYPTKDNLNEVKVFRAKARRTIKISKRKSWRSYVSKINHTLESPYHLAAVSGAHFTQGTILIVILVSSGSAKSRTHQSAVGGFLVTRRGWPGRLRACRIWTFINSV